MTNKEKVLHISAGELYNAGIETFIMNTYREIDRNKIQYDFLVSNNSVGFHDKEFCNLGGKLVKISISQEKDSFISKWKSKFKYFYEINKVIKNHGPYKAVHYHQQSWADVIMLIAFVRRVPIRISHSHNAYLDVKYSPIKKLRLFMRKLILNLITTHRLGCSNDACESLFGSRSLKRRKTIKINNGIDLSRFDKKKFNSEKVRNELRVNTGINFVNVGRFSKLKNQAFLIKMFSELARIRKNVHLTIIGWGDLESDLKELVRKENIEEMVSFLPSGSDIPKVLSTMDFFVFPSIAGEGLGIALIEAQSMGIPCFVSDAVPNEVDLGLCSFLALEKGEKYWAEHINESINNNSYPNEADLNKLYLYDVKHTAGLLQDIYINQNNTGGLQS